MFQCRQQPQPPALSSFIRHTRPATASARRPGLYFSIFHQRMTTMIQKVLLLVLTACCITGYAQADPKNSPFNRSNVKTIKVVAPEWEGYTNPDGSGLYWQVLKKIYEPAGVHVKYSNVPWNRAMKMVTRYSLYNAIVGEYLDTEEEGLIFPDYPIDVEYMSVLTTKSRNLPWNGTGSLAGKNVGWIKDYDVIPPEERNFTLHEFRTTAQGIEMLEAGEIDYMIDEWDEISQAVVESGRDMTAYVMNEMPEGTDVYVAFADSDISRVLIDIYNERIQALYRDGTLKAIYESSDSDIPKTGFNDIQ
ncbi:MAG: hypothetical protein CMI02_11780 [Oceanospirillaceae bacterium]|nr:hypothetical protein [Oceanospirillaceae bacterium]MBT12699.1 hypothetical protein [Oceanospirillaceae bacterium]